MIELTNMLLPLAIGILVAVLLLPLMKWQYRQNENEKNGFKDTVTRILVVLVALIEVVLLFGGVFLVLYLFREQRAEDKVMPLMLYEVPSLGFFLFYLVRYIIPARLRAEKGKQVR